MFGRVLRHLVFIDLVFSLSLSPFVLITSLYIKIYDRNTSGRLKKNEEDSKNITWLESEKMEEEKRTKESEKKTKKTNPRNKCKKERK